ncbi:MAG TPA: DmsC/YnfH family molybdoenzyme membrane anchor subunit [Symbiobacteriaceae bacterium]|nr:DmsC/YnfH family molybdoenzyme membrane anchor subunit [Symbiobacteriaceae bacterium]
MEWTSLILFTVLAEGAVGLVLFHTLFGFTNAARTRETAYDGLGKQVVLIAALVTGVAMLVSLTHLGWPQFAFRALGGLPGSWLSWEVLLTGIFAAGCLGLWVMARRPAWALMALSLVGLAATYASGKIYALPSVPANAGGFPPLLFLASALVAGPACLLLLLAFTAPGKELAAEWAAPLALTAVGAILLAGALTVAYAGAASAGAPEAKLQAAQLAGSAWYLLRLLLGLLLPAALLLRTARRPKLTVLAVLPPVLLMVVGELAGRTLFFTSTIFTNSYIGM